MAKKAPPPSFWKRHHLLYKILIGILIIVAAFMCFLAFGKARTAWRQHKLQPFYDTTGLSTEGPLGQIVRQEPLGIEVTGGTSTRVLYRTQKADGSNTFSSGMIFVPSGPAPAEGRPVVAWAHGTLGMGKECAPTRTPNPVDSLSWVSDMLANGWVVTATDYAGLGTPGIQQYLVGASEANDVLNSVRAAQNMPETGTNNQYAVWGHSQGGHSVLFTAAQAATYAPELNLIATIAVAPAAELPELFDAQENTAADWIIGPEVALAWPSANPALNVDSILTGAGKRSYEKIANKCIEEAALAGVLRTKFKQEFFSTNILKVPEWNAEAMKQTVPVLTAEQPLMVIESTTDNVVLPSTTALYIQRACAAQSNLTSLWVSDVTHMQLAKVTAPDVVAWLVDRFAAQPTSPTCDNPSPVVPAQPLN